MLQTKLHSVVVLIVICLGGVMPSSAQVNLQTGSAVYSLPMFNWQDDKSRLTSVVAINYNSGNGLKVNDIASNVGQGWNLEAGGVITRIEANQPDDQFGSSGLFPNRNDQDLTKYPNGWMYATIPSTQGCPLWLAKYPTYGAQNELYSQPNDVAQDRELDRFAFTFNGKSGEFVLDSVGGWHGAPLGDTKMKINFNTDLTLATAGIRTTITSFTITDVDGLIYKFTLHGLTKLLTSSFSNGDGSQPEGEPKIASGHVYCQSAFDKGPTSAPWHNDWIANPFIITNWYLSEVDDPFTGRKILYNYRQLSLSNSAGADISYNLGTDNYVLISYKKSITTTEEITSIILPDSQQVNFTYSTLPRADYPGQFALTGVSVTYTNSGIARTLSQYQLNSTYIIMNRYGMPSTPYQKQLARLYLRSVTKIGVDLKEDAPPYQFDYYTSTGSGTVDDFVPPPFCYSKDIWGYYNGNNSLAYSNSTPVSLNAVNPYALSIDMLEGLCFLHTGVATPVYNAKAGFAQNGLLKEIIYPTGGSLTYTYAQNTGAFISNPSSPMTMGGVHVSQTASSDGGYSNGCSNPLITQYNYVVNGTGSNSSLWGLETPQTSVQSNNFYKDEKQTIHFSLSSGLGCKWHYLYPGILNQYQAVSIDEFQRIMAAISPFLGVLGIISTIDDVVNIFNTVGFWTVAPLVLDVITYVLQFVFSCPQTTKNTVNTVYYDYDLNLVSPLPAQFKRVEVTESSGGIGKTVHEFTHGDVNDPNGPDYHLWFPGPNTALSIKQRFAPWAYGLPKRTTVYDVNGNMIKQTQNAYDTTYAKQELDNTGHCAVGFPTISARCQPFNSRSYRADAWAAPTQYDNLANYQTTPSGTDMYVDLYDTYTGHVTLDTSYERTYRVTDATQYVQAETDYAYNDGWECFKSINPTSTNFELNSVTTKQSNGSVDTKFIYYPWSFDDTQFGGQNNSGILQNLVNGNIVNLPVATQSAVGNTYYPGYLDEIVTEFAQLPNNDIGRSGPLSNATRHPTTSLPDITGRQTAPLIMLIIKSRRYSPMMRTPTL